MSDKLTTDAPGSPEAIRRGCLCRILFCLGHGSGWDTDDCPLHGEKKGEGDDE